MFWWTDTGVEKRSEGRTHDISETGAFVLAHTCPPSGIQIGFKVFLPMLHGSEPNARVEALGKVLRVEQVGEHGGRDGFAISTRHTLLRFSDDTRELEDSRKNKSHVS